MRSDRRQSVVIRRARTAWVLGLALALSTGMALPAAAHHDEIVDKLAQGTTELVSVSSSGEQGDGHSGWWVSSTFGPFGCAFGISASDDGRFVAFVSQAGNLHPSDTNGQTIPDVFVHDRKTGKTDLVSAMPNGLAPEMPAGIDYGGLSSCPVRSHTPRISGNGRYVAFASNLPLTGSEDLEASPLLDQVYVRDLEKRTTELVSRTWDGSPHVGVRGSGYPGAGVSISDNGRIVAFHSDAANIVAGVCDEVLLTGCHQVYARDMRKKRTVLVSKSSDGEPSSGSADVQCVACSNSLRPVVSGNGRVVAFASSATNLVEEQNLLRQEHAFIHDLDSAKTELVSVSRNGGFPNDESAFGWNQGEMSDDGRYVTFTSKATDLVPANRFTTRPYGVGTNTCNAATYVRDRKTDRTERTSVTSTGTMLRGLGSDISDDGRYVRTWAHTALGMECDQIETLDSDQFRGHFIANRSSGQVDRVLFQQAMNGAQTDGPPGTDMHDVQFGGNGRFVFGHIFAEMDDEVDNDTNEANDVVVRDLFARGLGAGGIGSVPPDRKAGTEDKICIAPDVCIPPQGRVFRRAASASGSDPAAAKGARLYGASLAHRPALGDLYVAIELEHMGPGLLIGPAGIVTGGDPSLLYGLRFEVGVKSYEVRATPLLGGTFGLFDCTDSASPCRLVTTLKGGYGTTGERVVFSLPLDEIGLDAGGTLGDVQAFSGLGSLLTGTAKVLDSVRLGHR